MIKFLDVFVTFLDFGAGVRIGVSLTCVCRRMQKLELVKVVEETGDSLAVRRWFMTER